MVTLEFIARRRSCRRFRDRRDVRRYFACDLYRVTAQGGRRGSELVCELARFDGHNVNDLKARAKFWREVSAALAPYLGEMGEAQRDRVLDQLARWVAPVSEEEAVVLRVEEERLASLPRGPVFRLPKK